MGRARYMADLIHAIQDDHGRIEGLFDRLVDAVRSAMAGEA